MNTNRNYYCGNCHFFFDAGMDGFGAQRTKESSRGHCRKNAPTMPPEHRNETRWPIVGYSEFCGEHPLGPLDKQQDQLARIATILEQLATQRG